MSDPSPSSPSLPFAVEIEADAVEHAPQYVIGSRSYLTDRAVPLPEIIVIPPRRTRAKRLSLHFTGQRGRLGPFGSWRRRLFETFRPAVRAQRETPVLDLRIIELKNWSHALNIAFPFALMVRDRFCQAGFKSPIFVCPSKMPGRIVELFERFELECIYTSGSVRGALIVADPADPNDQSVVHFRNWIAPYAEDFRSLIEEGKEAIPDKVFLDRRDSRSLSNGDSVRGFLSDRGFTTIYPEDLSLAQQFALLGTPSEIVAIHGAGIAPLMFRQPEAGPFRFVEILSPGHMTIYFRGFVQHLPGDYRAIRGRTSARMSAAAHDLSTSMSDYSRNFSLAPFEVDLSSLELALRPDRIDTLLWSGKALEFEEI